MFNINIDKNRNHEDRIANIDSIMQLVEENEKHGSKNHINFLKKMLIDCIYKSDKRLKKAIKTAKMQVQYNVEDGKWSKMQEVDYLEFLINVGIGAMTPMEPMGVPAGINPMAVSHLITGEKAPEWVIGMAAHK